MLAKDLDPGKAAVRAWLKLSSELHQDGFFRFAIMDDSTKAELVRGVVSASGKVVVMQGGNGELNAPVRMSGNRRQRMDAQTSGPTVG